MEAVHHSPIEKERARIMTFTYHIASSTLTVYEPPQEGSGLIQVRARTLRLPLAPSPLPMHSPPLLSLSALCLVFSPQGDYAKKHVPYAPDGHVYGPPDFYAGAKLTVYGREFTIVDADAETRETMRSRYNVDVGEAIPIPRTYMAPKTAYGHSLHANKVVCDVGDMEDPCVPAAPSFPATQSQLTPSYTPPLNPPADTFLLWPTASTASTRKCLT